MGLVDDAKLELDRINFGERDTRVMLDILRQFFHTWNSGGAVSVARPVLERLLAGKPLTPLTGEADEWYQPDPSLNLFQNKRCSTIFREQSPFDGSAVDFDIALPGSAEFPRGGLITFPHEVK